MHPTRTSNRATVSIWGVVLPQPGCGQVEWRWQPALRTATRIIGRRLTSDCTAEGMRKLCDGVLLLRPSLKASSRPAAPVTPSSAGRWQRTWNPGEATSDSHWPGVHSVKEEVGNSCGRRRFSFSFQASGSRGSSWNIDRPSHSVQPDAEIVIGFCATSWMPAATQRQPQ